MSQSSKIIPQAAFGTVASAASTESHKRIWPDQAAVVQRLLLELKADLRISAEEGEQWAAFSNTVLAQMERLTAMVNVAKMYYFGVGLARSYPEAVKWFQVASARGSAAAMNSLGLMYDSGLGVAQDRGAAATLLKRAAGLGYGPTMANLGSMYENGAGVENNPVEAYAWMDAALKAGIPAEVRDAIIYRLGAISARLNQKQLALALKRADEISSSVHVAAQSSAATSRAGAALQLSH